MISENNEFLDACSTGYLEKVKRIHATGYDIRAGGENGLHRACSSGHLGVVKYLVENAEVDIHVNNEWALRVAVSAGSLPVVKYLLEQGADIHACCDYALNNKPMKEYLNRLFRKKKLENLLK